MDLKVVEGLVNKRLQEHEKRRQWLEKRVEANKNLLEKERLTLAVLRTFKSEEFRDEDFRGDEIVICFDLHHGHALPKEWFSSKILKLKGKGKIPIIKEENLWSVKCSHCKGFHPMILYSSKVDYDVSRGTTYKHVSCIICPDTGDIDVVKIEESRNFLP